jgi:hypothetical protein
MMVNGLAIALRSLLKQIALFSGSGWGGAGSCWLGLCSGSNDLVFRRVQAVKLLDGRTQVVKGAIAMF